MSHSFDTRATRRVWIWWPSLADGDPTESTDHDRSIARISHSSTVDWWRNYGRTRREWLESQHGRSEIPFRSALCIFRFGNQTISIITGAADSVCDRISGISSERRSRNFFFCFFFFGSSPQLCWGLDFFSFASFLPFASRSPLDWPEINYPRWGERWLSETDGRMRGKKMKRKKEREREREREKESARNSNGESAREIEWLNSSRTGWREKQNTHTLHPKSIRRCKWFGRRKEFPRHRIENKKEHRPTRWSISVKS